MLHHHCPVSGSSDLRPLRGYENLVKSHPLGFVFDRRIPSAKELGDHYDTYARNDYLSPVTIKRYQELLDMFEPYRKTGRILDLGCGVGHFLEQAILRGWEVHGTEFSDAAIGICEGKGIAMKQGKTESEMYPAGHFDVVTSFEVIEHLLTPREEVESVRHFLRDGGLFYCTTPNFNAIERYRLKSAYRVISYPEHLGYFTPRTFDYLMKKTGFRKVFLKTTGLSLSTLLRDAKTKAAAGAVSAESVDEKVRQGFEGNAAAGKVKQIINGLLSLLGVGNSLKAAYVKAEKK